MISLNCSNVTSFIVSFIILISPKYNSSNPYICINTSYIFQFVKSSKFDKKALENKSSFPGFLNTFYLCPHPPAQFLQSQPHCRDFPLLLSQTIFLTANPTIITNTVAVMIVPIITSCFLYEGAQSEKEN